jgi:hypothetical protein
MLTDVRMYAVEPFPTGAALPAPSSGGAGSPSARTTGKGKLSLTRSSPTKNMGKFSDTLACGEGCTPEPEVRGAAERPCQT